MHNLIDWLPKYTPEQKYTSIVHGDYRLDNVVFHDNDEIQAMLDWELSTIGDPLADFGYHCMLWHVGEISDDIAKTLGIHSEKEYVDLYLSRTKMQLESEWDFYIIFSTFFFSLGNTFALSFWYCNYWINPQLAGFFPMLN